MRVLIAGSILLLCFNTQAGFYESLAQGSHTLLLGGCDKFAVPKKDQPNCPSNNREHNVDPTKDIGAISEQTYLRTLADGRIEALECGLSQLVELAKDHSKIAILADNFVDKIEKVFEELTRSKEQKALLLRRGSSKSANAGSAQEDYQKTNARLLALMNSLPLMYVPSIAKLVKDSLADGARVFEKSQFTSEKKSEFKKKFFQAVINGKSEIRTDISALQQADIDRSLKESLAQDEDLVEKISAKQKPLTSGYKAIACRVDAKYGKGAEVRDTTFTIVSAVAGGVFAGFAKGGAAVYGATAIRSAAAVGSISTRTALILRSTALAGEAVMQGALSDIDRSCQTQGQVRGAKSEQCDPSLLSELSHENCILNIAMTALGAKAVTEVVAKGMTAVKKEKTIAQIANAEPKFHEPVALPAPLPEAAAPTIVKAAPEPPLSLPKVETSAVSTSQQRVVDNKTAAALGSAENSWEKEFPKYNREFKMPDGPRNLAAVDARLKELGFSIVPGSKPREILPSPGTKTPLAELMAEMKSERKIKFFDKGGPAHEFEVKEVNGELQVFVSDNFLNHPIFTKATLESLQTSLKFQRDLAKQGIQATVRPGSTAYQMGYDLKFDKEAKFPANDPRQWMKNRTERHDLKVVVDDSVFVGDAAKFDAFNKGDTVYLRTKTMRDPLANQELIGHELTHAARTAKCLKYYDCSSVISFKGTESNPKPFSERGYENYFRADETEAYLISEKFKKSKFDSKFRTSARNFANEQIAVLEGARQSIASGRVKLNITNPAFPVQTPKGEVFINFQSPKEFKTAEEANEFYLKIVEKRIGAIRSRLKTFEQQ